ncbi:endolysin [Paraconexibacter sp. AEG42_29]|uniref:Endolysin n=1 Tax=Paraconexibacter sp. AEG42_29 TaxID=2997339 RepID=A0AAU7AZU2_9ACTN
MTAFRRTAGLLACILIACAAAPRAQAQAATYRLGERVLRVGATGGDVKSLQRLLTRAGHAVGADGEFGPGTRTAVRAFQRAKRRQQTGVVGPGTVRVLRAAAAAGPAARNPEAAGDAAAVAAKGTRDGGVTFGTVPPPTADAAASPAPPPPAAAPAAAATGPVGKATLTSGGLAVAPAGAPPEVVAMIAAANRIARTPYRYGGGHGDFDDTAYDCSGSVSYALHGAGLLDSTLDSSSLAKWGAAGAGRWVTIYANAEHVYMYVAGLRFDTSGQKTSGSRWQDAARSSSGFTVRHPAGL